MELNLIEVILAAVGAYALWKAEWYIRMQLYLRSRKPAAPRSDSIAKTATTENAASPIVCSNCKGTFKSFVSYADGDTWCKLCDATFED